MPRQVRCQITKEYGTSDTFYKAPNGKYYKSEEIYLQWKHSTQDRASCISLLCDYAGYNENTLYPTFLGKMVSQIGGAVGYDVLLETLERNRKAFEWANENKQFETEQQRLFYYQSIIKNNVIDVYKEHQVNKDQQQREERMTPPPVDLNVGRIITKKENRIDELLGDFQWI